MQPTDDNALLRQYVENDSDEAFATLVAQHLNLVYSVALRQVGNPHQAGEITQAVFIILAKKAAQLRHDQALASWLFQATRLTARNFVRGETRRHRREEEAYMQSVLDESGSEVWPRIAPLLDTAVGALREKDRRAIVLRFYEGRNLREIGLALGASEAAAEKRVNRALEKLHRYFTRHGISSTTAIIAETISVNSIQAAPAALAKTVTAVALAKGAAASTSTVTLVKGALKIMAWTKAKTTVVVVAGVLLAAGTTTIVTKRVMQTGADDPNISDSFFNPTNLWSAPTGLLILRHTHFTGKSSMTESRGRPGQEQEVRMMGRDQTIGQIFENAYEMAETETRIVLPGDLPEGNFDYLITLPVSQNEQSEALKIEIQKKLGLVGHFETRETNVLLLKTITPGVTGLMTHPDVGYAGVTVSAGQIHAVGQSIAFLGYEAEHGLKLPVVDQTGFAGNRYDYDLDEHLFDGTGDSEKVKEILRNEFDLELVPTNMPIEMLVVEKAK